MLSRVIKFINKNYMKQIICLGHRSLTIVKLQDLQACCIGSYLYNTCILNINQVQMQCVAWDMRQYKLFVPLHLFNPDLHLLNI